MPKYNQLYSLLHVLLPNTYQKQWCIPNSVTHHLFQTFNGHKEGMYSHIWVTYEVTLVPIMQTEVLYT